MIDKVLLTKEERNKLQIPYKEDDDIYAAVDRIVRYSNKAQCLKLLEWLKEKCKEHYHMQPLYRKSHIRRMACPDCMAELESKLKEG